MLPVQKAQQEILIKIGLKDQSNKTAGRVFDFHALSLSFHIVT